MTTRTMLEDVKTKFPALEELKALDKKTVITILGGVSGAIENAHKLTAGEKSGMRKLLKELAPKYSGLKPEEREGAEIFFTGLSLVDVGEQRRGALKQLSASAKALADGKQAAEDDLKHSYGVVSPDEQFGAKLARDMLNVMTAGQKHGTLLLLYYAAKMMGEEEHKGVSEAVTMLSSIASVAPVARGTALDLLYEVVKSAEPEDESAAEAPKPPLRGAKRQE